MVTANSSNTNNLTDNNSALQPEQHSRKLPTGTDVVLAAQGLGAKIRCTPLERSVRISNRIGRDIYLKREDIQVGRSYKVRGAYNFISALAPEDSARGIVCASAGNHAQGVAFSCNQLQIKGTIFIPSTTPRQKRNRIRDIGGEWVQVVEVGATFDECAKEATRFSAAAGAVYVHPFDDARTIAGQGTVVKKFLRKHRKPLRRCLSPSAAAVCLPAHLPG
ncbi:pyridoxal-phosphate dependent enzyme [Arcanobacterium hippocoleae]